MKNVISETQTAWAMEWPSAGARGAWYGIVKGAVIYTGWALPKLV